MKYILIALLALACPQVYAAQVPPKPPHLVKPGPRPLYPEPVLACKPMFKPVCIVIKRFTR